MKRTAKAKTKEGQERNGIHRNEELVRKVMAGARARAEEAPPGSSAKERLELRRPARGNGATPPLRNKTPNRDVGGKISPQARHWAKTFLKIQTKTKHLSIPKGF